MSAADAPVFTGDQRAALRACLKAGSPAILPELEAIVRETRALDHRRQTVTERRRVARRRTAVRQAIGVVRAWLHQWDPKGIAGHHDRVLADLEAVLKRPPFWTRRPPDLNRRFLGVQVAGVLADARVPLRPGRTSVFAQVFLVVLEATGSPVPLYPERLVAQTLTWYRRLTDD